MHADDIPDGAGRAAKAALFYRRKGWNALPSRSDRKGPALPSYADFWDTELPDHVYADWQAENVQVMTGARWGLCVVDCDGDEARCVWRQMKAAHSKITIGPWPTWIARTGGGGWHYWFLLPPGTGECPSGRLWGLWDTFGGAKHQGDWKKHQEVRLLADRSLVIAPPSHHVTTGKPYYWIDGRSPRDYPAPAVAPDWVLDLPRIGHLATPPAMPAKTQVPVKPSIRLSDAIYTREEVLDAIPDKIAVAQRWGLRFASLRTGGTGWCSVHAIDREDRVASAGFSPSTGNYFEQREGEMLTLFDLGVRLGHFLTWQDCKDALGDEFLPRVRTHARTGARPRTR